MHQHHEHEKKQNCCCEPEVEFKKPSPHNEEGDAHGHHHELQQDGGVFKLFLPVLVSFILLATSLILDHFVQPTWFSGWIRSMFYIVAYLPVGLPVLKEAVESIQNGDVFSEFLLMGIATVGAFAIGEYPEAVAVMLFYAVGEIFQTIAVSRAQNNIKALLDQRPDQVNRIQDGKVQTIPAAQAQIGDLLQLKVGEKVGLDGILRSKNGAFNTAALTGESKPDTKYQGDAVLAGMINLNTVTEIEVTTAYSDSKLSKILEMVQNATTQKAPTELFIRKFARIYTPIVVLLAIAISLLPYFFVQNYQFSEWLYRALVFLVISCPCALVISIPLGYFGGIGAASRNGILVKGSSFLDTLANIQNVVMDKTGTMTEGVFKVQEVVFNRNIDQTHMLQMVSALEKLSTHPVATAIHQHVGELTLNFVLKEAEEIAGHGLKATVEDKILLVGNFKLMKKFDVDYDIDPASIIYTTIAVAYDNQFVGYITIADEIKSDAQSTIDQLKALHVQTTMLSGDKNTVVQHVARQLGINHAFGDLLPEDKVAKVKEIKARNETVAFVGDGVNDAPVVALSDVGIAMGGLGSDATIETADIVIQDDKPSKIPVAIHIGKQTKKIVWQNITLAFAVKAIVLILGAGGVATMWEAVFADVGVSLLAIMNAIRIQRMRF
ncbi:heavy metal translocating P-type ATPase [Acinetobacter puyangensis]|uniref:P-type Zn(2+) transporter n=1 Tax=Acinetobacter puyangensis TaxID=1096779 RepID=A0A240EFD7_9GAMM|nr:heavy metal translocating P-type ATPase [Acinetobacter puyangensis]SNX46983.1 Cd2+/Zn2+-exporting ATPase [Acinetobacter puyangensis]